MLPRHGTSTNTHTALTHTHRHGRHTARNTHLVLVISSMSAVSTVQPGQQEQTGLSWDFTLIADYIHYIDIGFL